MKLRGLKKRGGSRATAQKSAERGVTLVETAVALVILMVVGLGVVTAFTYSIGYNSIGNDRGLAISIAQQQMEQLRTAQFTDAVLNVTPTAVTSNFLSNGRSFQITKYITGSNNDNTGNPTLKSITIRVDPINPSGFPVVVQTLRTGMTKGSH